MAAAVAGAPGAAGPRAPITWHWRRSRASRGIRVFARAVVKPLMTYWPMTASGIAAIETANGWLGRRIPMPSHVSVTKATLGGVPCELIVPRAPAGREFAGGAVLYMHGGAFLLGGPFTHRGVCAQLAEATGVPVYSVEYRQLPVGAVAASVEDAVAAYTALLDSVVAPARVIVAGDSAGGYLAMKISEIAALRRMQAPAVAVGFSPLLNLDLASVADPGYFRRDAYLPLRPLRRLRDWWLGGPARIEGEPSPIDADPALFPPTFFSAADYELLRPGVEKMTDRLHAAGVPVETHLWAGQVHAFPAIGRILPESREIVRLSVDFARRALRGELPGPDAAAHAGTEAGAVAGGGAERPA